MNTTTETLPLFRRAVAEFIGTGLLCAMIVGSGIAAVQLSPGDVGLQLLEVDFAVTLGLAVLIFIFQPISGGWVNPLLITTDWILGARHGAATVATYVTAQISGAIAGTVLANAMFADPTTISTTQRGNGPHFLAEVVATAGLVFVVFSIAKTGRSAVVAVAASAWLGAATFFTSSFAFANPALTIGRIFTDTFTGIMPFCALVYVGAQLIGAAIGIALLYFFFPKRSSAL